MLSQLISSLNKVMMNLTDLHALLGTPLKITALRVELAPKKTGALKLISGAMLTHLAKEVKQLNSSLILITPILSTGLTFHALRETSPTNCSHPSLLPLPLLLSLCEAIFEIRG
jgi:hypothetical protein